MNLSDLAPPFKASQSPPKRRHKGSSLYRNNTVVGSGNQGRLAFPGIPAGSDPRAIAAAIKAREAQAKAVAAALTTGTARPLPSAHGGPTAETPAEFSRRIRRAWRKGVEARIAAVWGKR